MSQNTRSSGNSRKTNRTLPLSICFVRKSQSLNVLDRYAKEKLIQANPSRHLPHHVTNLLATAALSACPPMRAGSRSSQGQSFS